MTKDISRFLALVILLFALDVAQVWLGWKSVDEAKDSPIVIAAAVGVLYYAILDIREANQDQEG